jgi:hypothetical protein
MSTVTTGVTKFQMGAAACAIAAAATLTPAAVAVAKPDLMPTAPMSQFFGTDPIAGPVQFAQDVPPWWLFGGHGGAAITTSGLPGTPILSFQPLALLPGFIQPLFGWFNNINISVCALGLGVQIGPYGTVSVKTGAC